MSIESALEQFVSSRTPAAIVLQAKWGLGKTYFWRNRIVKGYLAKPWRKKYSYVSLFGIGSLDGLKIAIYQATAEFDADLRNKWWRYLHPRWLWWKVQAHLPNAFELVSIPYVGQGVAKSYDSLSYFFVKDRLICFDDIERRGSGLSLLDFLGLVSQLVEQRNCRIVVILNTDALTPEDQRTWDDQKEKVFQGEMTYSPSTIQSIELGLEESRGESWYQMARDSLQQLGVTNIRVIQRTRRFISTAIEAAGDRPLRNETIQHVARVVPLLVFAHSGRSDGAPPLDYVMQTGPFEFVMLNMLDKRDEEMPEEQKRWMELISDYNLFIGADLDHALGRMVVAGFPDLSDLIPAIETFEGDAQRQFDKDAWRRAWRLYHDTVAENGSELADALETTWPQVSRMEHPTNLQSLVRLLRKVDKSDVASRFIQQWVDERKGTRSLELSSDDVHSFGQITDPEILGAIHAAYLAERPAMGLKSAIEASGTDHGHDDEVIAALAAATSLEIATALTESPGPKLSQSIKTVLRLSDSSKNPNWQRARENMKQALTLIAQRSALSEDRICNNFGICLAPDSSSDASSAPN